MPALGQTRPLRWCADTGDPLVMRGPGLSLALVVGVVACGARTGTSEGRATNAPEDPIYEIGAAHARAMRGYFGRTNAGWRVNVKPLSMPGATSLM